MENWQTDENLNGNDPSIFYLDAWDIEGLYAHELIFEPKDSLTLGRVEHRFRKLAPGPWIVLGWYRRLGSATDLIASEFISEEERFLWQVATSEILYGNG